MPEATTVFRAVDAQDLDTLLTQFAADARFVFGNQEPLVGTEAIRAGNVSFFTMIQGLSHQLNRQWTVDATTIAETDVTYTRLDGKDVTLPAISIWDIDAAGLITDYRIFVDLAPVFAP